MGKTANHADRESAGTYHHLDLQIDDSHRTIIDHGSWRLRDQFLHDKGVRTLQELKKEHPYKPASFGRSENQSTILYEKKGN